MIKYSETFLKEAKKLSKKYKLLKKDLKSLIKDIENNKNLGTALGYGIYKKRLQNSSIPTGKSGGFRVIIYQQIEDRIILLTIYSKTDKETLSDEELKILVKKCINNF
jgi:hypothetical protein